MALPFDLDPALLAWLAGASLLLAVVGALAAPYLIVHMPADYLLRERRPPEQASALRALAWLLRNTFGALLLLAGIAMLVLPGQGLLTILVAVSLMDLPRKHRALRWLMRRTGLANLANRLRRRAGKPPLQV